MPLFYSVLYSYVLYLLVIVDECWFCTLCFSVPERTSEMSITKHVWRGNTDSCPNTSWKWIICSVCHTLADHVSIWLCCLSMSEGICWVRQSEAK